MMRMLLSSPWAAITIAIVGVTTVYTVHLHNNGLLVSAKSHVCPAIDICATDTCKAHGCSSNTDCSHCADCV